MNRTTTLFKDSAFRHGFSERDYTEVLGRRHLVLRSRRGFAGVYEILGRNAAGRYVHVVVRRYTRRERRIVIVFHMAPMDEADRKRFRELTRR